MLHPQVVVNLLAELDVSMSFMRCGPRLGEIFRGGTGQLFYLILEMKALCSETNEFHRLDFKIALSGVSAKVKPFDRPFARSEVRLNIG